jgi:hypothetical protein
VCALEYSFKENSKPKMISQSTLRLHSLQ